MPRKLDPKWLAWFAERPESQECLFCTLQATETCHIEHGSNRKTDFLVYRACHDHHMAVDHAPRHGEVRILREQQIRHALAEWCTFTLSRLIREYEGEL